MKTIYVPDIATETDLNNSVFLAGPTPRSAGVRSWRPEFIQALNDAGFDGTVLIPEDKDMQWKQSYLDQLDWEFNHLLKSACIAFWIPRDLEKLPGFTTNVEFGYWLDSNKMFYGRPLNAPKTAYLDWMYKKVVQDQPCSSIEELVGEIIDWLD